MAKHCHRVKYEQQHTGAACLFRLLASCPSVYGPNVRHLGGNMAFVDEQDRGSPPRAVGKFLHAPVLL